MTLFNRDLVALVVLQPAFSIFFRDNRNSLVEEVLEVQQLSVEQAADLLQHYDQWLAEHMPKLEAQYPGKVVAIENDQVVAVGTTYREIYDRFQSSEREWMPLIVEVPSPGESEGIFL